MNRRKCLWLVAALFPAMPAHAANDQDFLNCDGYYPPSEKSEGIGRGAWPFGSTAPTANGRGLRTLRLWAGGVEACDRALNDPRLKDTFVFRRANLLQGKALHALDAKNFQLALDTISQSDQVGASLESPFFARSIGAGNLAVRAFAYSATNRPDEARGAIDSLLASRGWSQTIRRLALALDFQLDHSVNAQVTGLRGSLPVMPMLAEDLFWIEFLEGRYAEAAAIYPAIDLSAPNLRGSWRLAGEDVVEARKLEESSNLIGAAAYADLVLGNTDAARARMAEAMLAVEQALVPPGPRPKGKPPLRSKVQLYNRRKPFLDRAAGNLAKWQQAMEFRQATGERTFDTFERDVVAANILDVPVLADLLRQIRTDDPAQQQKIQQAITAFNDSIRSAREQSYVLDAETLTGLLPRPELPDSAPVLKPAGDGSFLTDTGLSREREEGDVWTIRFTHKFAQIPALEELVTLGAAQNALRLGFDSFMILNATSISRTTHVSSMYVESYEVNSGNESHLRVRYLHADQPAEADGMGWRRIDARQVIAELESRYRQSNGITIAF